MALYKTESDREKVESKMTPRIFVSILLRARRKRKITDFKCKVCYNYWKKTWVGSYKGKGTRWIGIIRYYKCCFAIWLWHNDIPVADWIQRPAVRQFPGCYVRRLRTWSLPGCVAESWLLLHLLLACWPCGSAAGLEVCLVGKKHWQCV